MVHSHHSHGDCSHDDRGALALALALNGGYALFEAAGGWWAGSLTLLANAAHMLIDAGSLGLALAALWFSRQPMNQRHTFGYLRAETLAALANALVLALLCLFIGYEAIQRLNQPAEVQGGWMLAIAIGELAVNAGSAWLLHRGQRDNLNVRGAFLHLVADALASIAAIAAAAIILTTHWVQIDPLLSLVVSVLVLLGTLGLLKESIHVLMQGTPERISVVEVEQTLRAVPEIIDVHDLHVWTLGTRTEIMTVHVVLTPGVSAERGQAVLVELRERVRSRFGIGQTTIQIEYESLQRDGPKCEAPAISSDVPAIAESAPSLRPN